MDNKLICVTGGLGFMGSYVTETCLAQDWYVTVIDSLTYASHPEMIDKFSSSYGPKFRFIQSDINDLKRLDHYDYIINMAAESHVDNSISNSDEFLRTNINGVYNMIQLIKGKGKWDTPTLLHFSTDEVYGDIINGSHTEKDLLKPSNPYSATKGSADMLILAWSRTFNFPYVIVRPTNNYGIRQYPEKLIPRTCKSLLLGKKVPLHNNGTPVRMWLHAQDNANAIITIINSGVQNEIFNISGNYEAQNIDIVKKIIKLITGKDDPTPFCDFSYMRMGQDLRYSLDDTKLKKLGWKPIKEFDMELQDIVKYYETRFIW